MDLLDRQYLTFAIGASLFAIPVRGVREVLGYGPITRLPDSHPYLLGVMDCRGSPIPIMDLSLRLGIEGKGEEARKTVIILELKQEEKTVLTGILVDRVQDVVEIGEGEINPPPERAGKYAGKILSGMVRADDGFLMLVDIDRVLDGNTVDMDKGPDARLEA